MRYFTRAMVRGASWSALAMAGLAGTLAWAEGNGDVMSYHEARQFLAKYTTLVELTNDQGARVAICPKLQGRVMTSTCAGLEGPSFGFINRSFLEQGQSDPHFNNYGAEDRMWLSPEGGPFSLWFKHGDPQDLPHWFTPPALNEGEWRVISHASDPYVRMVQRMNLTNTAKTKLTFDVVRDVRLARPQNLVEWFGDNAAAILLRPENRLVAYETSNTIVNRGADMKRESGLVSIWMLGMLNAGPKTAVIVPYRSGDASAMGPVVKSDYFGAIPAQRMKVLPQAVLFMADGEFRSKIGIPQKRARNVLGSIDFAGRTVTLVQFTMPEDPTKQTYMNNMWGDSQKEPYQGDVVNSYNDGPPEPGKKGFGAFYEVESLSPAAELKAGEMLNHRHRTLHVQAELPVLDQLVREVLGVDLQTVQREMFGAP